MVDTVCGGLLSAAMAWWIILALNASKPKIAPNTRPTAINMMTIRLSISVAPSNPQLRGPAGSKPII